MKDRVLLIDRALDLIGAAGPVELHRVALFGDGHEQADRHVEIDAVIVNPVLEAVFAIRQFAHRRSCQAFGIIDDFRHIGSHNVLAIFADQFQELGFADMAGGELGAQIAEHLDRNADVLFDDRPDRVVALAGVVQSHRRDAQAFLVNFG